MKKRIKMKIIDIMPLSIDPNNILSSTRDVLKATFLTAWEEGESVGFLLRVLRRFRLAELAAAAEVLLLGALDFLFVELDNEEEDDEDELEVVSDWESAPPKSNFTWGEETVKEADGGGVDAASLVADAPAIFSISGSASRFFFPPRDVVVTGGAGFVNVRLLLVAPLIVAAASVIISLDDDVVDDDEVLVAFTTAATSIDM